MDAMDPGSVVPAPHVARPLRLLPFRAVRLSPGRVGSAGSLRAFTRPSDDMAGRLERWERRRYLAHDDTAGLYVHEYTADGVTVRGLVGALDISRRAASREGAAVHPHEGVHPDQVAELADRMTRMRLQPAPILLVHRGPVAVREVLEEAEGAAPLADFTDRSGQHHRVWPVRESSVIRELERCLADATAVIADGHHRYAAYLRMADALPDAGALAGLAMLVDQDDTPLHLGAIHRTVSGIELDAMRAAAATAGAGWVETDHDAALAALGPGTIVVTDGRRWVQVGTPDACRPAVAWFHDEVVPRLEPGLRIDYHHRADGALAQARRGRLAVLMPAPDFDQVLAASAAGQLLPEKATSFQPKPDVGVFIRSLLDG